MFTWTLDLLNDIWMGIFALIFIALIIGNGYDRIKNGKDKE